MANISSIKLPSGNTYNIKDNISGYTTNTGTITKIQTTAGAHTAVNVSSGAVSFNVPTTAAHVGAVAISGNETIAGNKTFSGITSLTVDSTYPTVNGAVIPANATAIIQSPMPKYLWHDVLAFCRAATPKYYTSTNGTSWTEATLEKRLFGHQEAWGDSTVLSSSIKGSRWVWINGGFYASLSSWLVFGITYKNPSAHFDVLLETSSDGGSTWTTLTSATNISYVQTPIWIKNNSLCQDSLRLTITWNNNSASNATLGLCAIRFLTYRWGNQGKGSEFEHPYTWDANYNISPLSGAKFIGDLTGNVTGNVSGTAGGVAWANVSGKPTATGSKVTGITASTTATKTTLGTAFTIPNVTSAGSASTWAFEDVACDDITSWSAGSGSASISGAVDSSDNTQLNITISHTHTAPSLSYTAKTASHVKSGGNGSAPTLGTAFTVPNVTGNTSATVSITDPGHTHSV